MMHAMVYMMTKKGGGGNQGSYKGEPHPGHRVCYHMAAQGFSYLDNVYGAARVRPRNKDYETRKRLRLALYLRLDY